MASASRPGFGYQVPYAQQIRAEAGIMTQAVGLIIHADQAEKILRQGQADMVAIGREMLNNPHWAFDAASKLGDESTFKTIPANYSYWLEKRAGSGFVKNTSTWTSGIAQS